MTSPPTARPKGDLRTALRVRTRQVIAADVASSSTAICEAILAHEAYRAARAVAGFVGVAHEPDTRDVLRDVLAAGKALWLPRVAGSRVVFHRVSSLRALDDLERSALGLYEPPSGDDDLALTAFESDGPVDLVLVPGLAFWSDGTRLGRGKGFYDRLFESVRHSDRPCRLAVSLAAFVDPPEGRPIAEPHDVPVQQIVTERGLVLPSQAREEGPANRPR